MWMGSREDSLCGWAVERGQSMWMYNKAQICEGVGSGRRAGMGNREWALKLVSKREPIIYLGEQ